jgi:hypothetical protein
MTTAVQVKLLAYVAGLLPPRTPVTLVGDCEFGHPLLIENLRFWAGITACLNRATIWSCCARAGIGSGWTHCPCVEDNGSGLAAGC